LGLDHVSRRNRFVLSLNCGSSSLKYALYRFDSSDVSPAERVVSDTIAVESSDHGRGADAAFDALARARAPAPDAIGHRIVHGGPDHRAPVLVDDAVLVALRALVPLAPLHLPPALAVIDAAGKRFAGRPQVACFDTAFHRRMPELAQRLPLPTALWDEGVRRYGFHGLSYEYILGALGDAAAGAGVIAHLGNGASLAAVHTRDPIDTTMGLTPTGGLVMSTRSGDLDPGVLVYLARERGYDAAALERLVDNESGLLGVSRRTSDMRTLLEARAAGDPAAALAVDLFCYQARKHIGAMAAALMGLDWIVFTGGIGERAATVRAEICAGLAHLGVHVDAERNAAHAPVVSVDGAATVVRVIPTDEDVVIARHTEALTRGRPGERGAH
jgi:acetate kinase